MEHLDTLAQLTVAIGALLDIYHNPGTIETRETAREALESLGVIA